MHEFYNRALVRLFAALTISAIATYVCVKSAYLNVTLLPFEKSPFRIKVLPAYDHHLGGTSEIAIKETGPIFHFSFKIMPGIDHPYAAGEFWFMDDKGKPTLIDLSKYASMSFFIRCAPANILTLTIPTFDPQISKRDDVLSYRTLWTYVSCTPEGSRVTVDLTRLETPQWWYEMFKVELLRHRYKLDQVPKIAFGNTDDSLRKVESQVKLAEIELRGTDYNYLIALAAISGLVWSVFGLWFFRAHERASIDHMRAQLHKDLPFVAYRQLSIEPHRDKEKAAILHYFASRYADSDIGLESAAATIGTNRTKINEVLKAEFGLTFPGYLNQLRLTEAARLLSESGSATVAEIAYSVGYSNVSYFNKLFKEQYGCTPKAFRNVSQSQMT